MLVTEFHPHSLAHTAVQSAQVTYALHASAVVLEAVPVDVAVCEWVAVDVPVLERVPVDVPVLERVPVDVPVGVPDGVPVGVGYALFTSARILLLLVSATHNPAPSSLVVTSKGRDSCAEVAGPSSPEAPAVPVPAMV